MRYYNISNLSFSKMKIFMAAVEYDTFSDAGRHLGFTQSMVSKTIASLEEELGLILFIRQKNQYILTPAGRCLYERWKQIMTDVEQSITAAHIVQRGLSSTLRVGNICTGMYMKKFLGFVNQFGTDHPDVDINFSEFSIFEMRKHAELKNIDIFMTAGFEESAIHGLGYRTEIMFRTKLNVFVSQSHPLFNRDSVKFTELMNERFVILDPVIYPGYLSLLLKVSEKSGFTPDIAITIPNAESFRQNLLAGRGIVMADNYTLIAHKDIKRLDITDLDENDYNGIILCWLEENNLASELAGKILKNQKMDDSN